MSSSEPLEIDIEIPTLKPGQEPSREYLQAVLANFAKVELVSWQYESQLTPEQKLDLAAARAKLTLIVVNLLGMEEAVYVLGVRSILTFVSEKERAKATDDSLLAVRIGLARARACAGVSSADDVMLRLVAFMRERSQKGEPLTWALICESAEALAEHIEKQNKSQGTPGIKATRPLTLN
jgi:hypothetical protein